MEAQVLDVGRSWRQARGHWRHWAPRGRVARETGRDTACLPLLRSHLQPPFTKPSLSNTPTLA